ncbi:MAG: ABC transporter permease [Lachnospiraceae bacterium]|nr:ABC transporter permease [Lachnospiraceae bacterium]
MLGRVYIIKLKEIFRNKYIVGWNFLFPVVLGTAFYLGFGNLIAEDPDSFTTIDVGYVNTSNEDTSFSQMLEILSEEGEGHVKTLERYDYDSEEEAVAAMNNDEISGVYLDNGSEIETIVPKNGYEATVLNQIVRVYRNRSELLQTVATDHPENLEKVIAMMSEDINIMKKHDFGTNTSAFLQYFYALIAMASLFSSWISTSMLENMCANMSECGKRVECAPASKMISLFAGVLAGMTLQSLSNAIVVVYLQKVLGIDLGAPMWNVILISTIGSGLGISSGILMGAMIRSKKLLSVIPIGFSMLCSFCSGLMWDQIRQIIEANVPILNRINPAALLVDCLYIRATYGLTAEYYRDVYIMCGMIVVSLFVSSILLRRRRYVSI